LLPPDPVSTRAKQIVGYRNCDVLMGQLGYLETVLSKLRPTDFVNSWYASNRIPIYFFRLLILNTQRNVLASKLINTSRSMIEADNVTPMTPEGMALKALRFEQSQRRIANQLLRLLELDLAQIENPDDPKSVYGLISPEARAWADKISSPEAEASVRNYLVTAMKNLAQSPGTEFEEAYKDYQKKFSIDPSIRDLAVAFTENLPLFGAGLLTLLKPNTKTGNHLYKAKFDELRVLNAFSHELATEIKTILTNLALHEMRVNMNWHDQSMVGSWNPEKQEEAANNYAATLTDDTAGFWSALPPFSNLAWKIFVQEVLETPFVIRPKKRSQYGDYLFLRGYAQIGVWLKDNRVEKLELFFLSDEAAAHEVKRLTYSPEVPPLPAIKPSSPKDAEATRDEPEGRVKSGGVGKILTPLNLAQNLVFDPKFDAGIRAKFEELNSEHPGQNAFLIYAAILLSENPQLQNPQDLNWFFAKISSRQKTADRLGDEAAMVLVDKDFDRYLALKENLKGIERDLKEPDNITKVATDLENILEGTLDISALTPGHTYSFKMNGDPEVRGVRFSNEVIEFLKKDPLPMQWLRALKKGYEAQHSGSGVVRVSQKSRDKYGLSHELKILRRGPHIRIGLLQNANGSWDAISIFDYLR